MGKGKEIVSIDYLLYRKVGRVVGNTPVYMPFQSTN